MPTCLTTYTSGMLRTHFHGGLSLRPLCVLRSSSWTEYSTITPSPQSCLAWQRRAQCPTCLSQGCGWTRLPSHQVLLGPGWWTDCVPCASGSYQSILRPVASLTPPLRQAWRVPSAFGISLHALGAWTAASRKTLPAPCQERTPQSTAPPGLGFPEISEMPFSQAVQSHSAPDNSPTPKPPQ